MTVHTGRRCGVYGLFFHTIYVKDERRIVLDGEIGNVEMMKGEKTRGSYEQLTGSRGRRESNWSSWERMWLLWILFPKYYDGRW